MSAGKHITPILLIVVAFVALVSTYAWFSMSKNATAILELNSGTPSSFSLGSDDLIEDGEYVFEKAYHGQIGYKDDGSVYAYGNVDAPFYLFQNIKYEMQGGRDLVVKFNIERAIVQVGAIYLDSFEDTLKNVFGFSDSLVASLSDEQKANYMGSSLNNPPNGVDASKKWCVVNGNGKVTHIVFEKEVIYEYFHFNYWESTEEGILPNDEDLSLNPSDLLNGISLEYGVDVLEAGVVNYAGVYVGFYGYNSDLGHYMPCTFSPDCFRGSKFRFIFSAGGV